MGKKKTYRFKRTAKKARKKGQAIYQVKKGWRVRRVGKRKRSWKARGYKSKRAYLLDRAKKAKYRPAKKYKKGRGHKGDWARKRYKKKKK